MTTENGTVEQTPGATPAAGAEPTDNTSAFAVEGVEAAVASADKAAEGEGGSKPAKDEAAPQGAPETYADFVLPEGVTLDSELLAEFTPVLKELNLSQEAAQKVIDFAPKLISQTIEGIKSQLVEEARSWHESSRKDTEIGGEKMAERLAVANKAFEKFGSVALKEFLASRGLNAHPELIRAFYRAGKAISEDTFVPGGKTPSPRAFYDNSRMN